MEKNKAVVVPFSDELQQQLPQQDTRNGAPSTTAEAPSSDAAVVPPPGETPPTTSTTSPQHPISSDQEEPVLTAYLAEPAAGRSRQTPKQQQLELVDAAPMVETRNNDEPTTTTTEKWTTACLIVVLVGGLIGLVVGLMTRDDPSEETTTSAPTLSASSFPPSGMPSIAPTTEMPTAIPTATLGPTSTRLSELLRVLEDDLPIFLESGLIEQIYGTIPQTTTFSVSNLDDPNSPQYRAAQWMADVDDYYSDFKNITFSTFAQGYEFMSRYALAVFYYSTGGPESWTNQCQFLNSSLHYCDWQCEASDLLNQQLVVKGTNVSWAQVALSDPIIGVKCGSYYGITNPPVNQIVVNVEQVFNGLSGTIPPELGWGTLPFGLSISFNPKLRGTIPWETFPPWITTIHMQNNALEGCLSSAMGRLGGVGLFWISDNNLVGSIPTEIGNMANVQTLDVSGNALTGSLPTHLAQLTKLHTLYLPDNFLTGRLPRELFFMESLRDLNVAGNVLSGRIPEFASENETISPLTSVQAGRNALNGTVPTSIARFTDLQTLLLSENELTGTILEEDSPLWKLTNLTFLSLDGNWLLSGTLSTEIGTLSRLVGFLGQRNQLEGSLPTQIGKLSRLRLLGLGENMLTGPLPSEIGLLTELSGLAVQTNELTGEIPASFMNLTSMDEFQIHRNKFVGSLENLCLTNVIAFQEQRIDFNYTADCDEIFCPCCTVCCRALDRTCEAN